jgi:hypothetical protein
MGLMWVAGAVAGWIVTGFLLGKVLTTVGVMGVGAATQSSKRARIFNG